MQCHRVLEELCRAKADAARAAEEEQALLDMLWQEEQAARAAEAEAALQAKRRHMQEEMRAANQAMLTLRVRVHCPPRNCSQDLPRRSAWRRRKQRQNALAKRQWPGLQRTPAWQH